jgi:hypothetical protein
MVPFRTFGGSLLLLRRNPLLGPHSPEEEVPADALTIHPCCSDESRLKYAKQGLHSNRRSFPATTQRTVSELFLAGPRS